MFFSEPKASHHKASLSVVNCWYCVIWFLAKSSTNPLVTACLDNPLQPLGLHNFLLLSPSIRPLNLHPLVILKHLQLPPLLTFTYLFLPSSVWSFTASTMFFGLPTTGTPNPDARMGDHLFFFFICFLSYKTDDCLSRALLQPSPAINLGWFRLHRQLPGLDWDSGMDEDLMGLMLWMRFKSDRRG